MTDNVDEFGAMPLLDKLRLAIEWAPVLARLQAILQAPDPHEQALGLVALLQWAAGRTETEEDDQALKLVAAALSTPECRELLMFAARKVGLA